MIGTIDFRVVSSNHPIFILSPRVQWIQVLHSGCRLYSLIEDLGRSYR